MSSDIEKRIQAIKKQGKLAAATPESAKAFLMKVGIIDENGELTPRYGGRQRRRVDSKHDIE